ncbi:MAG: DapH/DapD/GlmU-related protein [Clostridia bacterium]
MKDLNDLINNGVIIVNTQGICIDDESTIESGARIEEFCVIMGASVVKKGATIKSFSTVSDSIVGENTAVGPMAHLREHSIIGDNCKIGNFVEIKHSFLGNKTKAAHLAYIGDAYIGDNCNIGCGVIFCNYNGKIKNTTFVGNNCFIGSNSNLIAPISIGDNCFIAAATTVTASLPSNSFIKGNRDNTIYENREK